MGDSVHFVKSIPPRACIQKVLGRYVTDKVDVHEEVKCLKNILTNLQLRV